MKKDFKNRIVASCVIMLLTLVGVYFVVKISSPKIIINQCPEPTIEIEQKIVEEVELERGWKCDKPTMTTDLLQPSGYWIGDTIDCWKLETPIEEYRIKMCKETYDDYWCKKN